MDNIENTRIYFNKNAERLRRIKNVMQPQIAAAVALSLDGKLKGNILDIGSGGQVDYSLDNINKLVSLDISREPLERLEESDKIKVISADARHLDMERNSFDCVVALHAAHHLAGNNLRATRKNVKDCFSGAYRVLKEAGKILIVDAVCPKTAQKIEDALFNFIFAIFSICQKPMVYYFSISGLMSALRETGFKKIKSVYLPTGDAKLCPFTSAVGIPFKYTPLSHVLLEGVK